MWGNDKSKWYPLKGTMVILGLNVDYTIICKKKKKNPLLQSSVSSF